FFCSISIVSLLVSHSLIILATFTNALILLVTSGLRVPDRFSNSSKNLNFSKFASYSAFNLGKTTDVFLLSNLSIARCISFLITHIESFLYFEQIPFPPTSLDLNGHLLHSIGRCLTLVKFFIFLN